MEAKFSGCEFLDYEPHYGECKRQAYLMQLRAIRAGLVPVAPKDEKAPQ